MKLTADEVERTVAAVMESDTVAQAAERLGISRQALYKRLRQKRIVAAVARAEQAAWSALRMRLLGCMDRLVQAIEDALHAHAVRPRELASLQLRTRTAFALLDRLAQWHTNVESGDDAQVIDDLGA